MDEDVSAEYIAGEVVFLEPVTYQHQALLMFLTNSLAIFIEEHDLGRLLTKLFKVKLSENYVAEPDICFVSQSQPEKIQEFYVAGTPDLMVEITTPESFARDRGGKFLAYETAGVPEYWLIDPWRKQAEFYQLDGEGYYQLQPLVDGRYHSRILPSLALTVAWLWQNPLPKIKTVLQEWQLL